MNLKKPAKARKKSLRNQSNEFLRLKPRNGARLSCPVAFLFIYEVAQEFLSCNLKRAFSSVKRFIKVVSRLFSSFKLDASLS